MNGGTGWDYEKSATHYYHIFTVDGPLDGRVDTAICIDVPQTASNDHDVREIVNALNRIADRIAQPMKFKSSERSSIADRGNGATDAFVVPNPAHCREFSHLVGKTVEINDERWEVIQVDCYMHCAPWTRGERIGLIVRAAPAAAK